MLEPTLIEKVTRTWAMGGWTMIPLALLSLVIYSSALRLLAYFRSRNWSRLDETQWRHWVQHPQEAEGELGEIIRYTQDEVRTADEIHNRFSEVTASKLPPLDQRLGSLNLLITAAPLMGLLGTVYGMLVTFKALALGGGQMTEALASGISMALFPPEVGLCVALPGLALVYLIKRKRQEYEAFLAQLESATLRHWRARRLGIPEPQVLPQPALPALEPAGVLPTETAPA
jgi:biopolymer transport protein ExbB